MARKSTLSIFATPTAANRTVEALTPTPTLPISSWDVEYVLSNPAYTTVLQVFPTDGVFGHDKTMNGIATLSFPANDEAVSAFMGVIVGREFNQTTLRVYCRGRVVFPGVAVAVKTGSNGVSATVDVTFEHAWPYFIRKRAVYNSNLNSVDNTEASGNNMLQVMRNQIGPVPIVPSGHPGTRTDFGDHTVTVSAAHSPAHGLSIRINEQSGNNLLDLVNEWLECNDLAPVITDSYSGAWQLDNAYPFEDEDLSTSVIFGQWHGNLQEFSLDSDRTGITNIWGVEGKTANSCQWTQSAPSIVIWGEVDGFAQKPQDTNVTAVLDKAGADLITRTGSAKLTYTARIIETDGHRFVTDWFWRNKIQLQEAIFGYQITGTVNAFQMRTQGSHVHEIDIVLGEPRVANAMRELIAYVGLEGPRFGGTKWRNRRQ